SAVGNGFIQLRACSSQQVGGYGLQAFELLVADVRPFVLLEAEHEKPAVALVGGYQRAHATTLAAPRQPDAFLHHTTAEVSVDQTSRHLLNGFAQDGIGELCLAHPSLEVASFEYSRHRSYCATEWHSMSTRLSRHPAQPTSPFETAYRRRTRIDAIPHRPVATLTPTAQEHLRVATETCRLAF